MNIVQLFAKVVNNPPVNSAIQITKSSKPLPIQMPNGKPIMPNENLEIIIDAKFNCDPQSHGGLVNFK